MVQEASSKRWRTKPSARQYSYATLVSDIDSGVPTTIPGGIILSIREPVATTKIPMLPLRPACAQPILGSSPSHGGRWASSFHRQPKTGRLILPGRWMISYIVALSVRPNRPGGRPGKGIADGTWSMKAIATVQDAPLESSTALYLRGRLNLGWSDQERSPSWMKWYTVRRPSVLSVVLARLTAVPQAVVYRDASSSALRRQEASTTQCTSAPTVRLAEVLLYCCEYVILSSVALDCGTRLNTAACAIMDGMEGERWKKIIPSDKRRDTCMLPKLSFDSQGVN